MLCKKSTHYRIQSHHRFQRRISSRHECRSCISASILHLIICMGHPCCAIFRKHNPVNCSRNWIKLNQIANQLPNPMMKITAGIHITKKNSGVAIGCAGCATHKGPSHMRALQQSEGPSALSAIWRVPTIWGAPSIWGASSNLRGPSNPRGPQQSNGPLQSEGPPTIWKTASI